MNLYKTESKRRIHFSQSLIENHYAESIGALKFSHLPYISNAFHAQGINFCV